MDIRQAKEQVRGAVTAYLSRDGRGVLRIPTAMQRPLFLVGPPGVGKTAIVSQVAAEMGINFVSYAMTHHTRQSALGLPFIVQREFGGAPYQVSEYAMSEIIGAVHAAIERTGVPSGILFLDEVNCVSETLAPAMLQFLQYKTFGQHALPEGWTVVCASNPPEYNRAAREFDPATLDRLKRIPVEPDVKVWLDYAAGQGVHPAVLGFLQARPDAFYQVRAGVEGMRLVTARGWEDLSRIVAAYEAEGLPVDEALVAQYLQDGETAQDFAIFHELYATYRQAYDVAGILAGAEDGGQVARAKAAAFDERIALAGLLSDALARQVREAGEREQVLRLVREDVLAARASLEAGAADALEGRGEAAAPGDGEAVPVLHARVLRELSREAARAAAGGGDVYAAVRDAFNARCREAAQEADAALVAIGNAYGFADAAFGAQGQETLAFTARLAADAAFTAFAAARGSAPFAAHARGMLIPDRVHALLEELD